MKPVYKRAYKNMPKANYEFISAPHYRYVGKEIWLWPHFTPEEMADRYTGQITVSTAFMTWLEGLRRAFRSPLPVSSGYRTPDHQIRISKKPTGAHTEGWAADILVHGEDAYDLVHIAMDLDVLGLGINQVGEYNQRYIHVDMWPQRKTRTIWTY